MLSIKCDEKIITEKNSPKKKRLCRKRKKSDVNLQTTTAIKCDEKTISEMKSTKRIKLYEHKESGIVAKFKCDDRANKTRGEHLNEVLKNEQLTVFENGNDPIDVNEKPTVKDRKAKSKRKKTGTCAAKKEKQEKSGGNVDSPKSEQPQRLENVEVSQSADAKPIIADIHEKLEGVGLSADEVVTRYTGSKTFQKFREVDPYCTLGFKVMALPNSTKRVVTPVIMSKFP